MDEEAYTVRTLTDDPGLLEQLDGDLEDAEASASQVNASASRSFQEARELLSRVKSARGYPPVVGIGAFDCLAQPSTDRKSAKSRGKGNTGKTKGRSSSQKSGKLPRVPSLVLRCPGSIRLKLVRLVVVHITLLAFVLVSACCVDKWDIVRQSVAKGKATAFSSGKRAFGPVLWVVPCSKKPNRTRSKRE